MNTSTAVILETGTASLRADFEHRLTTMNGHSHTLDPSPEQTMPNENCSMLDADPAPENLEPNPSAEPNPMPNPSSIENRKSKIENPSRLRKFQPTPDQLTIVRQLKQLADEEKSHAEFVRRYCDFGPAKLSKIFTLLDAGATTTSYFDDIKDPDSELAALELLLVDIRNQRSASERARAMAIYPLSKFRAVAQAVRECKNKANPERIVKYLAPTGGGKSALCVYLQEQPGISARIVEVREAWLRSYFTVLTDLCRAIGLRPKTKGAASSHLEAKLIEAGNQRQIVLALDEGEFFGSAALNGIKLLLNKARFTFIICSIPEAHDKWNDRYPHEADQIARRTHAIVELDLVAASDVKLFFEQDAKTYFTDPEAAYAEIATAASHFGHFSFVARCLEKLRGIQEGDARDVAKAISSARKQMLRQPGTALAKS